MGFTVVELVIVMLVIAILLTIGALSLRHMQSSTRDREREADIQAIQNYLEDIYPKEIRDTMGVLLKPAGAYPAHVSGVSGTSKMTDSQFAYVFNDLSAAVKKGPLSQEEFVPAKNGSLGVATITSPVNLINQSNNYSASQQPGRPNGAYVYYANNGPGTNCDTAGAACRRYILLYHMETVAPNTWKVVEGKRL